jgi:hypothetical protein
LELPDNNPQIEQYSQRLEQRDCWWVRIQQNCRTRPRSGIQQTNAVCCEFFDQR